MSAETKVYNDEDFIKLVLEYRYVRESDIEKCREFQAQMSVPLPIGEILRQKKYLTKDEYNVIITLLKYKTAPIEKLKRKAKKKKEEDTFNIIEKNTSEEGEESYFLEEDSPPFLTIIEGNDKGKVYPLVKDEITIGRVRGADIRLDDCYVSRIHCKIIYNIETENWDIIDMMSSHGVYVNGERIPKKRGIKEGDQIQLGDTILKVSM